MPAEVVLDASALVAFLKNEPGADVVDQHLDEAVISTANLAETGDAFVKYGGKLEPVAEAILALPLTVVPVDFDLAMDACALFSVTRAAGLSLGDRLCLALAKRLDRIVLTADRPWAEIAGAAGVQVKLIR